LPAGLEPSGALAFRDRGKTLSFAPFPLEMEVSGKTYRSGLAGRKGAFTGTLRDGEGPFLSCRIFFREIRAGNGFLLEERRTYRALRDIPKALLTVRYFLDPVRRRDDGFLVLPALWYGDNEAWNGRAAYPKGLDRDWGFTADGSSCPGVVWTTPRASYAVTTGDSVRFPVDRPGLDDVLGVGFAGMGKRPQAVFTFPAQQVPQSYPWGRKLRKARTPRLDWKKGRTLSLVFRHQSGKPDRSFHSKVWRSLYGLRAKKIRYSPERSKLLQTAGLFTHCLKKSHFIRGKGFSHRHDIPEIFTGWCGGFAAAYAALVWGDRTGDREFRAMGETMCDYLCREGLSPSGIFYSENARGLWLQKVYWAKADGLHMRNASEGSCYLALALEHESARGFGRPLWKKALKSNLDAVLGLQRGDGAIPHEIEGRTGKPVSWTGATSGAWVGALAIWARMEEDPALGRRYLAAARRAGDYYLKNYVERERYIGGPYDTYMAPNMEDPYNLLLAYAELYETTGGKKWLGAARRVADHLLSWRYLYDVRFPDRTVCRKNRVRTAHMSPASVSNKHIQNWDTLADGYLRRLSAWTKDPLYADCALQHLAASTQLVQKGQLPKGIPFGGQSEQWYATDFNWFGNCGNYSKGNLWRITVALPKAGFLISLEDWLGRGKG
jgi:hypothetical protein